jgi:mannose-1-phosphate guanylyltransferase
MQAMVAREALAGIDVGVAAGGRGLAAHAFERTTLGDAHCIRPAADGDRRARERKSYLSHRAGPNMLGGRARVFPPAGLLVPSACGTKPQLIHTMVLCAGLGQRLRPLTDELPKPLMPVGDRSVLAHIAGRLRALGRSEAVANTHWMADKFVNINDYIDVTLKLVYEAEIRGVAGAVAGARPLLAAPVVVWSGDILVEAPPLDELAARAAASGQLCLAVAAGKGAGTVGLDAAGRIVRVRGESHGREVRGADYVSLFAAGGQALADLPDSGDLFADYCLPRMRRGEPIETCPVTGRWWDIGTPSSYLRMNLEWLVEHANAAGGSFVAASAAVASGVSVEASVVGSGARVTGSGRVERCVIWPGSTAVAPLAGCVVTPRAVVQTDPPPAAV